MAKKCNKCSEWREETQYGKDVRNQDGLQGICNDCKKAANKRLREKREVEGNYKEVTEKNCSQCSAVKPAEEFFRDKAMPDGLATVCKTCKKAKTYAWREKNKEQYNASMRAYQKAHPEARYGYEIKRRYGCTLEAYNAMLTAQEGACAICKKLHNPAEKKGRLFVDHDHITGAVRALLCSACNLVLGYACDDTRVLLEAVAYLARHKITQSSSN